MANNTVERLPDRVERLLTLADEVETAALAMAGETQPEWRRRKRTYLLKIAVRYGIAMRRALRPPRPR
jgi:hypothetical protein